MAVVLTLVHTKLIIHINETVQKHSKNNTKHSKYKNIYCQNTHITKPTDTHKLQNPHIHTHPHITKFTHTYIHTYTHYKIYTHTPTHYKIHTHTHPHIRNPHIHTPYKIHT